MPLTSGQTLQNRYRVVKLIGQGGFGAVYRAWDTAVNQPIALKENLDTSAEAQRQFQREATVMAGLRHPNLPRVTDHFLIAGQGQYLVMDFVEGNSLGQMLAERGRPFSEADVLPWVEQVCDALHYLHTHTPPIIHRDIKPQNIIITPNGRAMLVDFGISKIYDPTLATTIGAKAVTPGYSPPEQYGSGATDARADIYALGATLYTLLSGQEPPESVDLLLGSKTMPPPRQLNVQISADLEQVILKAMDTKTSRRFQNVTDLKTALLHPGKGEGAARWPQWAWGALALLVVVVVSGLLWANRGDGAGTPTAVAQIAVTETAVPPSATTETTIVPVITTATTPTPTPTTAATATIRSTATPRMAGPTMSTGFRVRISSQYSSVYVRRGPGAAYATLTTLRAGEEVVALAKNRDDTWYNVELADGQRGWISVSVTERVDTFTMADIAVAATIPATPTATITPTRTPTRPLPTATSAPSQPEPQPQPTTPPTVPPPTPTPEPLPTSYPPYP